MLLHIYLYLSNYFPREIETCDQANQLKGKGGRKRDRKSERSTYVNYPPKYKRDKMLCSTPVH